VTAAAVQDARAVQLALLVAALRAAALVGLGAAACHPRRRRWGRSAARAAALDLNRPLRGLNFNFER
jgi:hypothetical protein